MGWYLGSRCMGSRCMGSWCKRVERVAQSEQVAFGVGLFVLLAHRVDWGVGRVAVFFF